MSKLDILDRAIEQSVSLADNSMFNRETRQAALEVLIPARDALGKAIDKLDQANEADGGGK